MPGYDKKHVTFLLNVETNIVLFHEEHPDLSDHDVSRILESLVDAYRAEKVGRDPRGPALSDKETRLKDMLRGACEWFLGRVEVEVEDEAPEEPETLTTDEVVAALRSLMKSVKTWNGQGGPQGYLEYARSFVNQVS